MLRESGRSSLWLVFEGGYVLSQPLSSVRDLRVAKYIYSSTALKHILKMSCILFFNTSSQLTLSEKRWHVQTQLLGTEHWWKLQNILHIYFNYVLYFTVLSGLDQKYSTKLSGTVQI